MEATRQIERYLDLYRLRLKQLVAARGIAVLAIVAVTITVVTVTIAIRTGFPSELIVGGRVLLLLSLTAIAVFLIVRPNRRIAASGASDIEARTPAFAGRVETYTGIEEREHPLRDLLAEDTLRIAASHPAERQIPQKEFSLVLAAAALSLAGLLWLAIAGPGNYAYGVRHLWAGWVIADLLPPQSIDVAPGDDGIRRGGTVRVRATPRGFSPGSAFVHASFGDGDWQQVEMAAGDGAFEFAFFSVRQPLQYYVSAAGVRSETFTVEVVELPAIEDLVLTYRFPDWTNRQPEIHDPGGDVRVIAGTEVQVTISADGEMPSAVLVVDEVTTPMDSDGRDASGEFTVTGDGQYYVAASVGGERIRMSDDYFISVLKDELPELEFARPGRDWSASNIEEVTTSISAIDDYGLESLQLRYSVNGGGWQSVDLPVDNLAAEVDHVFFLESMSAEVREGLSLVPGDLVSYYARASDRSGSSSTDIFFIDVQPFDRRYSQSQQMGGGAGQQGNQQEEISQRQREIIVSTWNLIREQKNKRQSDAAYVPDNAALLSRVQATLKQQAETLAERTQARQLVASDEKIALFVENLNKAAAAMVPASERLAEVELEQAILPEQEALQYLLRAEAVFTDISLSLQANNRGGGSGGRAGRDLTDMFELEMDLEKNQYETGDAASPETGQQQLQEAQEELGELARRQEQLARNMQQNRTPTPAQRWQQEMLRRDLEELRERLEQMQQSSAANQQSSGGQSQSGSPQQQSGSPQQQQPGEPGEDQMNELQRRLESATRAMNEVDDAMREGADAEQLQRASAEARRQLEGAQQRLEEERQQAARNMIADLARRAEELRDEQSGMEQKLQDAIRNIQVGRNELNRLDSGMSLQEEYELAEAKRELQAKLQKVEQETRKAALALQESEPAAAEQLEKAIRELRDMEVEARLAVAANFIEQGEAVYVAASESAVTEALRELSDDLRRAESMTGSGSGEQREAGQGGIAQTLDETRQLRRELQRLAGGETSEGLPVNRGRDDRQRSSGIRVADLETERELDRSLDNISEEVIELFRGLRAEGVSEREIDELRRLSADIRAADFSGNEDILQRESRLALSLVEQLELALARVADDREQSVRVNAPDDIPDAHREKIADYYRRLGDTTVTAADEGQ